MSDLWDILVFGPFHENIAENILIAYYNMVAMETLGL